MVALIGALMSILGATGNVLQEAFANIIPDYVIDFFLPLRRLRCRPN